MKMFDILRTAITIPTCNPQLRSTIINYLEREKNNHHGLRFRMSDIRELAKERQSLEKICWKNFPNAVSNW